MLATGDITDLVEQFPGTFFTSHIDFLSVDLIIESADASVDLSNSPSGLLHRQNAG